MKTFLVIVVATIAVGVSGTFAAEEPAKVEAEVLTKADRPAPERELSPMMVEINAALESTRLEVADLKRQYDTAGDEKTAMDLMQEVARVKRASRVEMMLIQLRFARLESRHETAAKLEEIVEKMTAPPAKGVPIPRADNHK